LIEKTLDDVTNNPARGIMFEKLKKFLKKLRLREKFGEEKTSG